MRRANHKIYVGNSIEVLKNLPGESVHCVVTSPPYWGLRDYGVEGQLGLEKTPDEYVEKLVEVFREVKRVLRDDGTLWLNLGDCYYGSSMTGGTNSIESSAKRKGRMFKKPSNCTSKQGKSQLKPKDLVGIPWMVAFALRADGWYLRQDIIWAKGCSGNYTGGNTMPESVKDRCTKAHEYIFLLSKNPRYYYDNEAIKEPISESYAKDKRPHGVLRQRLYENSKYVKAGMIKLEDGKIYDSPKRSDMRNRRSVWAINTKPFPGAHFSTFPPALVEPCILAGTSERGCCPKCGAPWKRIVERKRPQDAKHRKVTEAWNAGTGLSPHKGYRGTPIIDFKRWQPTCSCGIEETAPCVVLDPFGGSGTTSFVAARLGRSSIYIDLNEQYAEMAKRRITSITDMEGKLYEN